MRRRVLMALALCALAAVTATAPAATDPLQLRAEELRYAVAATAAYAADHGTYTGMTLAKLRRYDRKIRNIAVRRANRRGYCIESTKRPFVHLNGPGGVVRTRRCGSAGVEVPRPGQEPPPPPSTPQDHLRYATPAIAAYAANNGGYAGMTVEALQYWDKTISEIRIVWTTKTSYCIEAGTGADTYHKAGPGASIAPGSCPAPPS